MVLFQVEMEVSGVSKIFNRYLNQFTGHSLSLFLFLNYLPTLAGKPKYSQIRLLLPSKGSSS